MGEIESPNIDAWEQKFLSYIEHHPRAPESLRALEEKGIPKSWLLEVLHDYADPSRRQRQQNYQRTVARENLRAIVRLIKILDRCTKEIVVFEGDPALPDWVKSHRTNHRRGLRAIIATYADSLREMRRENSALASNKGEGVCEDLLVWLVEAVTAVTGEPRWSDLANLVEAAYYAHGRKLQGETADRDMVRKRYKRFLANFPRLYENIYRDPNDWASSFGLPPVYGVPKPGEDWWECWTHRRIREKSKGSKKSRYGKIHKHKKNRPTPITEHSEPTRRSQRA
jgi:hypothetical protein